MIMLRTRKYMMAAALCVFIAAPRFVCAPAHAEKGVLAALFGGSGQGGAAQNEMRQYLAAGQAGAVKFFDASGMRAFYASRDGKPVWTDNAAALQRADAVWDYLERTWTHGLNPAQYNVTEIGRLLRARDPRQASRLELLLTDAVMHYGHDITGMRLRPSAIGQDPKYWRKPLSGAAVMENVAASDDPARLLAGLAPQDSTYKKLQTELTSLAVNAAHAPPVGTFGFGGHAAVPGHRYGDIPRLRERLGVPYTGAAGNETLYDEKLAGAVRLLQQQNGLAPDGVIGAKTLALINLSPRDRMEQIVVNMERMRWMDQQRPDRYVLVNIPQQMLWAVDHGRVAAQMQVVVGQVDRQTKAFKTDIVGIRFNPHWTVPLSIKMKDFLPSLREDPSVLARKGIDLYRVEDGRRVYLDPASIDWNAVTAADMGRLHMVQQSGEGNSLGLIRVLMPNDYDIYLHDTNHRDLFARNDRFFSSGCIRLSDPVAMARFVLADNPKQWTDAEMQAAIAQGEQKNVMIPHPLPIYITYITVWSRPDGRLAYGADIYGLDRQLIDAMGAARAYWLPSPRARKLSASADAADRKLR